MEHLEGPQNNGPDEEKKSEDFFVGDFPQRLNPVEIAVGAEVMVPAVHQKTGMVYAQNAIVNFFDRKNKKATVSYRNTLGKTCELTLPFSEIYSRIISPVMEHGAYTGLLKPGAKVLVPYTRGGITYAAPCIIDHYDDIKNIATVQFYDRVVGELIVKECAPEDLLTSSE